MSVRYSAQTVARQCELPCPDAARVAACRLADQNIDFFCARLPRGLDARKALAFTRSPTVKFIDHHWPASAGSAR